MCDWGLLTTTTTTMMMIMTITMITSFWRQSNYEYKYKVDSSVLSCKVNIKCIAGTAVLDR